MNKTEENVGAVVLILLIFSFVFTACARDAPMGGWAYTLARSYRE